MMEGIPDTTARERKKYGLNWFHLICGTRGYQADLRDWVSWQGVNNSDILEQGHGDNGSRGRPPCSRWDHGQSVQLTEEWCHIIGFGLIEDSLGVWFGLKAYWVGCCETQQTGS